MQLTATQYTEAITDYPQDTWPGHLGQWRSIMSQLVTSSASAVRKGIAAKADRHAPEDTADALSRRCMPDDASSAFITSCLKANTSADMQHLRGMSLPVIPYRHPVSCNHNVAAYITYSWHMQVQILAVNLLSNMPGVNVPKAVKPLNSWEDYLRMFTSSSD